MVGAPVEKGIRITAESGAQKYDKEYQRQVKASKV